jgi:hypothetical protein
MGNTMKKTTAFFFVLISVAFSAGAQTFEIFGFSGYTFGDKLPISGGTAKIYDGHTYGGILGYNLSETYVIEVLYSRQDSRVTAFSDFLNLDVDEPISANYILAGSNRLIPLSEKATFFSGVKLGAVIFGSKDDNFDDVTKFAAGLNGGFKTAFTENIGVRLQANLNFPITDVGASLWWSSGGGTNVGVSSYTPVIQFGFTGGLVYRF